MVVVVVVVIVLVLVGVGVGVGAFLLSDPLFSNNNPLPWDTPFFINKIAVGHCFCAQTPQIHIELNQTIVLAYDEQFQERT